jgi:hypothetical protein
MTTPNDPELSAMSQSYQAIAPLDADAQARVLAWLTGKLGLKTLLSPQQAASAQRNGHSQSDVTETRVREGTVSNVTIKLGADSCRTLLISAAAFLSIYRVKESFSRDEWLICAKEARMWKSDYSVQTSINIKRLLESQFIFEKGKDMFAISLDKLKELETKLAE